MIKVRWYASDGYVGKDRPQFFSLDPTEFVGMDRAQVAENLAGYLSDDFQNKVVAELADEEASIDEIMAAAKAAKS
jgi:hypothetical protein